MQHVCTRNFFDTDKSPGNHNYLDLFPCFWLWVQWHLLCYLQAILIMRDISKVNMNLGLRSTSSIWTNILWWNYGQVCLCLIYKTLVRLAQVNLPLPYIYIFINKIADYGILSFTDALSRYNQVKLSNTERNHHLNNHGEPMGNHVTSLAVIARANKNCNRSCLCVCLTTAVGASG